MLLLKWNRALFAVGGHTSPLGSACAAPQFLVPVQNASFSHPPLVAMVIAVEPGLCLASPACGAERPLTCPGGLLGLEIGLPGAVTQSRQERAGPWTPGNAPVSARGRKDEGDRRQNGLQTRGEAQRQLRGAEGK